MKNAQTESESSTSFQNIHQNAKNEENDDLVLIKMYTKGTMY